MVAFPFLSLSWHDLRDKTGAEIERIQEGDKRNFHQVH